MNAYTVLDSVNKYRHGVLVGNFVEDKFGKDLQQKGPNIHQWKKCTTKDTHNLDSSLYQKHPIINQMNQQKGTFYQTAKQITQYEYQRPQNQTSYNIFHRQQVFKKVPILENNPKKQEKQIKEGLQYSNTRYYLSNKFVKEGNSNQTVGENNLNSGKEYSQPIGQIPDILTGQIWKLNKGNEQNKLKKNQQGQNGYGEQKVATKLSAVGAHSLNPYSTSAIVKPQIQKFDEVQYKKFVLPNDKGEHKDILFGHGLSINQFHRRQLATTYDLSYNQQVKPQTQINSFYNPDFNQSSKKFHRETVYEKNYQQKIPEYNDKNILSRQKVGRPYDPYTKTFDKNHMKYEYLRQPI